MPFQILRLQSAGVPYHGFSKAISGLLLVLLIPHQCAPSRAVVALLFCIHLPINASIYASQYITMATEAPPIGPGFDLYADQSGRLKSANIALIILPTIFVVLRLVSRKVSRAGYWHDDLLVLLALLFSYGLPICNLVSTLNYGYGRHIYILPLDTTPYFLKLLYVFEILYILTTGFNKLAILAFYRRIFPIQQLRLVLLIVTAIVTCFTFTNLIVVIFQCTPIHTFWDVGERMIPGYAHCINVDDLFLASGSVNCLLDFLITMMVRSKTCVLKTLLI